MTDQTLAPTPDPDQRPEEPELGLRLRRLRKSMGLSQQQMARALGMSSHSSIAYYETGRRIPPADIIDAYERALNQPTGSLHQARLRTLAARAERDERDEPTATASLPHPRSPEPVHTHALVSESVEQVPESPSAAPIPRTRRHIPRPRPRSLIIAAAAVGSILLATMAASTATGATLDPTWSQSTQNVTARVEPSPGPEPMDGDDPRARDCYFDAVVVQEVPLLLPGGKPFGTLRLRHSKKCGTSWGSAYYSNPQLYTIRITVHRPADNGIVRDDWSNNTPPGSYSDMLSTGTGCVWVEAVVITPAGTGPSAATGCHS